MGGPAACTRCCASTSSAAGSSSSAWTTCTTRAGTTSTSIPGARAWRHLQYDRYLRDEVLPFTRARERQPVRDRDRRELRRLPRRQLRASGTRDRVNRIIGMSGLYDIKRHDRRLLRRERVLPQPGRLHAARARSGAARRAPPAGHHPRDRQGRPVLRTRTGELSGDAVGQGDRQRPARVGRLRPRLAVLGADDSSCTSAGTTRRIGAERRSDHVHVRPSHPRRYA